MIIKVSIYYKCLIIRNNLAILEPQEIEFFDPSINVGQKTEGNKIKNVIFIIILLLKQRLLLFEMTKFIYTGKLYLIFLFWGK